MARVQHNKLVRDGIPNTIASAGDAYDVRTIMSDEEFEAELRKKIVEEAVELKDAGPREDFLKEYADLMIALDALTHLKEFSEADIKLAIEENIKKKGKFEQRLFLNWSEYT